MTRTIRLNDDALASRFLSGLGIAECPIDQCRGSLASLGLGACGPMRSLKTTNDPARALSFLSQLSWPDTRHVLFATHERCCFLINNSRNGSDYADHAARMARQLQSRFARIVCRERRDWSNATETEVLQYEARIFELFGADGESIRAVSCVDDGGRWSFRASGTPHALEQQFPYDARRKRDRFSVTHLDQLVDAFGLQRATAETFLAAGHYFLFDLPERVAHFCSLAEADDPAFGYYRRGLGWVAHIETHATSVVADLERCVRLNPDYEPKVRAPLAEAYAVIARR